MRGLLRLIKCEFWKFKRTKLFTVAIIAAFIFPLFYAALLSDANYEDYLSGVREENAFLLLIPLLIILATKLFFVEQDNDTLKNLICIPVTKKSIVLAKILILLIFSIIFQVTGFIVSTIIAILQGIPVVQPVFQFFLTASTGILMWAAALPCVVLVVWFNKSYILSVIIVFFYTLLNYAMHFSNAIIMQPIGLNAGTWMPVPIIFRWLYQFYTPIGEVQTSFYERFSQYFVPTYVCFGILLIEAVVCIYLIVQIYKKREN